MSRFLSISAYAKECGVSRYAIYDRANHGKLVIEQRRTDIGRTVPAINVEEYPPVTRQRAGRKRKNPNN